MCPWNRPREALDTAPKGRPDNNKRRLGGISNKAAAIRCYMRSPPASSTSRAPSPRLVLPSHSPNLTSIRHNRSPGRVRRTLTFEHAIQRIAEKHLVEAIAPALPKDVRSWPPRCLCDLFCGNLRDTFWARLTGQGLIFAQTPVQITTVLNPILAGSGNLPASSLPYRTAPRSMDTRISGSLASCILPFSAASPG
jgi:hypothetical protein